MKFIYGPPVQEDDFINRVEEIKRLTSIIESFDYTSPVHIEISAPRRIGKTSLILEVGRRLKESGYTFLNIDLLSFHNITAAVEEIRNKVIESLPYTQAAIKMFAGYLKNIRLGMPKKLSVSDKGITVDGMDNIFSLYKPSWKETLTELFTFLRNNRDRRFVISLDEIGFIRNVKDREDAQEFLSSLEKELSLKNTPPFIINGSQNFLFLLCEISGDVSALWKRKLLKFKVPNFSHNVTQHMFIMGLNSVLKEYKNKLNKELLLNVAEIVYFISSGYPSIVQIIGMDLSLELGVLLSRDIEITSHIIEKILFDHIFIKEILRDSNGISKLLLGNDTLGEDYIKLRDMIVTLYGNETCCLDNIKGYATEELYRLANTIESLQYITLSGTDYTINYNFLKYYIGHPVNDDHSYKEVKEKWEMLVSGN
jgi:hypothetical protein